MNFKNLITRRIALLIISTAFLFYLCRNLNPLANQTFLFHDMTQYLRIDQYALNIKYLNIPPRMAPDFSYGLGYPVFNFYAPFVYIISSIIYLFGFNLISTVKIVSILAIINGFIGGYFLLKQFFQSIPSLIGASLYASCLYLPLNIFIRGNLGETWFISLFPWVILALYKLLYNHKDQIQKQNFLLAIFLTSIILLAHNLLSFLVIPVLILFSLFSKRKKQILIVLTGALLICAFYYLPLIVENKLTYAYDIATKTNYQDHFVCPGQLWQSDWLFGGSTKGCTDGMSFMLGKIQILLLLSGTILFTYNQITKKDKKYKSIGTFFILITYGSIFMATSYSSFIWQLLPFLKVIQFPWRFLALTIPGIAFLGGYVINSLPKKTIPFSIIIIISLIIYNGKYFYGKKISTIAIENKYLTYEYLTEKAALQIPEYLPKTADYNYWKKYQGKYFASSVSSTTGKYQIITYRKFDKKIKSINKAQYLLNISYFPYWEIKINNKIIKPNELDKLGRPEVYLNNSSIVSFRYRQSSTEQIGNLISLLSLVVIVLFNNRVWMKQKIINN